MSHKSNTRVYKLKNYGNMTLRVESAPVAQCNIVRYKTGSKIEAVRFIHDVINLFWIS